MGYRLLDRHLDLTCRFLGEQDAQAVGRLDFGQEAIDAGAALSP
jgi:hypothetical protein